MLFYNIYFGATISYRSSAQIVEYSIEVNDQFNAVTALKVV